MKYLLDTNVLSESTKPRPDPAVERWTRSLAPQDAAASVLSIGELRYGVLRLKDPIRTALFEAWIEKTLLPGLSQQVLNVDRAVIDAWAHMRVATGRTLPGTDSLIAATALAHGLILATRNERDFITGTGVQIINPWTA